jgi:predicted MFS family arabinose efflux permease
MPLFALLGILLINSSSAAFRDVAVDGIMCVEGKKYEATGRIQSVQWISALLAGLITGIGGAYLAEHWGYQVGFLCLVPVYLIVAIPAYFYREDQTGQEKRYANLFSDLKKLFTDKKLLLVCLFIFLYKFSPSFGTPLLFIERNVFKWSKMWIGTLGTVSMFFGILGAVFYYNFSKRINFKKWLYYSVLLGAVTTLSYLYFTPSSAVVYNILYSFLGMFIFIMIMDLMARKSVKGFEATSFALLCSVNNLADAASNISGGFLLPIIGLKWLIVISALASFLCLPLIRKID